MAKTKQAFGYCENADCVDYNEGVLLQQDGDPFSCPRCGQLGQVEYREITSLPDESLRGRFGAYPGPATSGSAEPQRTTVQRRTIKQLSVLDLPAVKYERWDQFLESYGEGGPVKLVYAAILRYFERSRRIRLTEFETRQLEPRWQTAPISSGGDAITFPDIGGIAALPQGRPW